MEDVNELLERPNFYHNIDGAGELAIGFMMIGFMAFEWVGVHARQDSIWNKIYTLPIFATLLVAAIHYGTKAMKSRITYRRTGFVSYRNKKWYWPGVTSFVAAFAVSVSGLLTLHRGSDITMLAMLVIGFGLAATYAYGFARAVRWKWIVAVLLLIGAVVIALLPAHLASAPVAESWITSVYNARFFGSLFLYSTFYGLSLLISGAVSLALYLHVTRGIEAE